MKNPLHKRILREIRGDLGKYIVLFLFMAITIGFISGFLVAGESMVDAYNESFDKYNIEYGNFELLTEMDVTLKETLEKEGTTIYPNYYVEEPMGKRTIRIFPIREEVNKVCVMKGELPANQDEIAIDRMFADNNTLSVGDRIEVGGKELTVSALVALSDYSALYQSNNELMFDATLFGVAVMTKEGFSLYGNDSVHYSYSWQYDKEPADEIEEKEMSDAFVKVLSQNSIPEQYIPRYLNNAIKLTGEDLGSDSAMMKVLLYILIAIIAFIFGVTTSNTIVKESTVIGTLRASGYTKGELIRHYMTMPTIVTIVSAIVGNVLGYTTFKDTVAGIYYGSYSLPTYETRWNAEAFILTTIVPLAITVVINYVIIASKMNYDPLAFLKRNLTRKKVKAWKLPNFRFLTRFRLRIIMQNVSSYVMLIIGVWFASMLLIFGLMMPPLIKHYQDETLKNKIAEYQYILKAPVETENGQAEKYCAASLKIDKEDGEEISIYGIQKDSDYVNIDFKKDGVYVSDSYAEKFCVRAGDRITLRERFSEKRHTFKVAGVYDYPPAVCIFMENSTFCKTFDVEEGYFSGYFSNEELTDIDEAYVFQTITEDDLTKMSRQLDVSMGNMFYFLNAFSVVLYILLIYLLTKLVIEKNSNAISMVKILGYENGEIRHLYMLVTAIVVIVALLSGEAMAAVGMQKLYHALMQGYSGWLTLYIAPSVYVEMTILGVLSYVVVEVILYRKIKGIPMDQALKNVE